MTVTEQVPPRTRIDIDIATTRPGTPGGIFMRQFWQFVPAKTPSEIVRKISVDTIAALADPVVKSKLEQAGYMMVGSSPDELQTLLKLEIDSAVIKRIGIKIN
jgi:tripartite-type tricarboxylate transporter receptor subunit TctC